MTCIAPFAKSIAGLFCSLSQWPSWFYSSSIACKLINFLKKKRFIIHESRKIFETMNYLHLKITQLKGHYKEN